MAHFFPNNIILEILKLLYNIAKLGTYWWKIYYSHHRNKLNIIILLYNLYLLFITTEPQNFGNIKIQINDIFNIINQPFLQLEEKQLHEAKLQVKPKIYLLHNNNLEFNGTKLKLESKNI